MLFNKGRDGVLELLDEVVTKLERQQKTRRTCIERDSKHPTHNAESRRLARSFAAGYDEGIGFALHELRNRLYALRRAIEHDGANRTAQKPLFSGLDCLAGQADLFDEGEMR